MQYAIAQSTLFHQLGFNTDKWRKSLDGTQSLVHFDMVEESLKEVTDYEVYRHDDAEFKALMASPEWMEQVEEDII